MVSMKVSFVFNLVVVSGLLLGAAYAKQYIAKTYVEGTLRINCGGPTMQDTGNRTWVADSYFLGGVAVNPLPTLTAAAISALDANSFNNSALFGSFRTWRSGNSSGAGAAGSNGSYAIPVAKPGLYFVRLYFAEMEYGNPALRSQAVAINNFTVLDNFNTPQQYYQFGFEYSLPINSSHIFINFTQIISPMPAGLYRDRLPYEAVLTTQYRWRADAVASTSFDSLSRQWSHDTDFIAFTVENSSVRAVPGPVSVAPGGLAAAGAYEPFVYAAQRRVAAPAPAPTAGGGAGGGDGEDDQGLTTQLFVLSTGLYLVRLHFVEADATAGRLRLLDVALQGETVAQELSILEQGGGTANKAVVLDYNTTLTSVSAALTLSIRASASSQLQEPILSGAEIFSIQPLHPIVTPPPSGGGSSLSTGAVVGISVAAALVFAAMIAIGLCTGRHLARQFDQGWQGAAVRAVGFYSLDKLNRATDRFSDKLKIGEGGFGKVYKATLDGQVVAIKRANLSSRRNLQTFTEEVDLISQLNHVNLIKLLGFCSERKEQIFVYEFRLSIAVGAARALGYLHSYAQQPIIHRDVKSENILLDSSFEPKVADFGLLKRIKEDQEEQATTKIAGTRGYMDPEYYATFQRPVIVDNISPDNTKTLVAWVKPYVAESRLDALADPKMEGDYPQAALHRVVELALACVQQFGQDRPDMAAVTRALERICAGGDDAQARTPGSRIDAMSDRDGYASSLGGRSSRMISGSTFPASSSGGGSGSGSGSGSGAGHFNPSGMSSFQIEQSEVIPK
eukprot:jgi/Mesen1/10169/ME000076S09680